MKVWNYNWNTPPPPCRASLLLLWWILHNTIIWRKSSSVCVLFIELGYRHQGHATKCSSGTTFTQLWFMSNLSGVSMKQCSALFSTKRGSSVAQLFGCTTLGDGGQGNKTKQLKMNINPSHCLTLITILKHVMLNRWVDYTILVYFFVFCSFAHFNCKEHNLTYTWEMTSSDILNIGKYIWQILTD